MKACSGCIQGLATSSLGSCAVFEEKQIGCKRYNIDATDILNKLRQKHSEGHIWYGVDINKEDISDNFTSTVWEPAVVKINSITAASGILLKNIL